MMQFQMEHWSQNSVRLITDTSSLLVHDYVSRQLGLWCKTVSRPSLISENLFLSHFMPNLVMNNLIKISDEGTKAPLHLECWAESWCKCHWFTLWSFKIMYVGLYRFKWPLTHPDCSGTILYYILSSAWSVIYPEGTWRPPLDWKCCVCRHTTQIYKTPLTIYQCCEAISPFSRGCLVDGCV